MCLCGEVWWVERWMGRVGVLCCVDDVEESAEEDIIDAKCIPGEGRDSSLQYY